MILLPVSDYGFKELSIMVIVENKHERFRVDLPGDVAEYYKQIAQDTKVTTPTVLKMVLSSAAKNEIALRLKQ